MKRKGFLLLILLVAGFFQAPVLEAKPLFFYGKGFEFQWYLGTLDFGLINSDEASFYFGLNFVSFSFMEQKTKIGIEFDPIQYNFIRDPQENLISFGQITLFWDILKLANPDSYGWGRGIIGPFVRFDFFVHNTKKFDIHKRIYTAGIQCAYDIDFMRVIGMELAYRNFDNKSSFYISIKIWPLAPILALQS
jgi:hypothetical protein